MKTGLDWKIVGFGLDWMCIGNVADYGLHWMCIEMDLKKIPLDCSVRSSRSKTQVYLGKLVKMVLYTQCLAVLCGSC